MPAIATVTAAIVAVLERGKWPLRAWVGVDMYRELARILHLEPTNTRGVMRLQVQGVTINCRKEMTSVQVECYEPDHGQA